MPRPRISRNVFEEPSETRERLVSLILHRRRETTFPRPNPLEIETIPNFELELLAGERRENQLSYLNADSSGHRSSSGRTNIPKIHPTQSSSLDESGDVKTIILFPLNRDGTLAESVGEPEQRASTCEKRHENQRKTAIRKNLTTGMKLSNIYNHGGRYNSPPPQAVYNGYNSSDCESFDSCFEEKNCFISSVNINRSDVKKQKSERNKFLGPQKASGAAFNPAARSKEANKQQEQIECMDIWSKPFAWFTLPGEKMRNLK